ncbi:MAG: hypothetical protein AB7K71_09930 [Polyangiaceae bacterium]
MLGSPSPKSLLPTLVLLGASLLACKQSDAQNTAQPAEPAVAAELPQAGSDEGVGSEATPPAAAPAAPPAAAKDDSGGWKCSMGMFSPCDCPDGSEGIHACDDKGNWGACDCTPAKPAPKQVVKAACVDGQTRSCPCGDGTFGRQTCDRGKWPSGCFLCD